MRSRWTPANPSTVLLPWTAYFINYYFINWVSSGAKCINVKMYCSFSSIQCPAPFCIHLSHSFVGCIRLIYEFQCNFVVRCTLNCFIVHIVPKSTHRLPPKVEMICFIFKIWKKKLINNEHHWYIFFCLS